MVSSVSPKTEIWFLRVCHHILTGLYISGKTFCSHGGIDENPGRMGFYVLLTDKYLPTIWSVLPAKRR